MKSLQHEIVPVTRQNELVIEHLSGEMLVYDLRNNKAHCLGSTAALIWQLCDGRRSLTEIAAHAADQLQMSVTLDVATFALNQLRCAQLLEPTIAPSFSPLSRRDLFRKAGAVAATAVVTSIVAPTVAQAATCLPSGATCETSAQCCSGLCITTCA